MFPTKLAPGIRSLAQSIWILLLPIPHFFEISVVDRYFIGHLTNQLLTNAYNAPNFIIVPEANKVNLDVMPFPDSWTQIRFFLRIIHASLLGEQCPDGRFLLGWEFPSPFDHRICDGCAFLWNAFHIVFIWKNRGRLVYHP